MEKYNYFIDISSIFFIICFLGTNCQAIISIILEWLNQNTRDVKTKLNTLWEKYPIAREYISIKKFKNIEQYENETSNFNDFHSSIYNILTTFCFLFGITPFILHTIINLFNNLSTSIHYIIFSCLTIIITTLIYIPIDYYSNFCIDEKYKLNTMTKKLFVSDIIKHTIFKMVSASVIIPILNYMLTNFGRFSLFKICLFVCSLIIFCLIIEFLYMTVFIKFFNTLTPLKNKRLLNKITNLLEKYGYNSNMVYVMNYSIRSNISNAFICGFGKSKKIILFDTLLKKLTESEIVAIVAHELAHGKLKHQYILRGITYISILISMLITFLFIYDIRLYHTFGFNWITEDNVLQYSLIGYFLMSKLIESVEWIFEPLISFISRWCEYSADKYAVLYNKNKKALINALIKITAENYSTIFPSKFYEWFYYSHPSLVNRINKIHKITTKEKNKSHS
jgi:STE24 endopeptidase